MLFIPPLQTLFTVVEVQLMIDLAVTVVESSSTLSKKTVTATNSIVYTAWQVPATVVEVLLMWNIAVTVVEVPSTLSK